MTLPEIRTHRRDNKRMMKMASGEALRLREELEDVLAALIYKLSNRR